MINNRLLIELFGEKLSSLMKEIVEEFETLDYDDNQIMNILKNYNESVRMGIYLIALQRNLSNVAYRINRVNKKINSIRVEQFIEAYEKGNAQKFLNTLGKGDKISLMSDLGIDLPLEERLKLSKRKLDYFTIISNSIMNDQAIDTRDGIDTFLKYKKDIKKA